MSRKSKPAALTTSAPAASTRERQLVFGLCVLLAVLTGLVFGQTLQHDFVNYDDMDYVAANAEVSRGLSFEGIWWAFTHFHSSNWHPLTWISHMIDCQLYGLSPWGHHLTSVLFHAANAILLFLALRQLTGKPWTSAFAAALFALHPLRVESVAWVSERKDVLSGFFFMLTLIVYARYARSPSRSRYFLVAACFALGLMCKAMLVSMPLVLLLLDYWPLQRLPSFSIRTATQRKALWAMVREKLPLFGLALASSVITVFAQRGSLQPITAIPFLPRLANGALSYIDYLRDMFWPANLAVLYPWDASRLQPVPILIAFVVLAGIFAAIWLLRQHRYLVTGWFWYLIMLVPAIGILQVGNQSHADRYTYLPQIGIYLILAWGGYELWMRAPLFRIPLAVTGGIAIVTLALCARTQAAFWQDSESLWTHALAVTKENIVADGNLGLALHVKGRDREAMLHFENSLTINRHQPEVLASLGAFYLDLGRVNDSIAILREAIEIEPKLEDAHYNLGNTYFQIGQASEALAHYRRALEIEPNDTQALNNMSWILATWPDARVRDGLRAVAYAERADSLTDQRSQIIAATLAAAYAETGRFPEAVRTAERALRLAIAEHKEARALSIRDQLETYKSGNAFRDNRFSVR